MHEERSPRSALKKRLLPPLAQIPKLPAMIAHDHGQSGICEAQLADLIENNSNIPVHLTDSSPVRAAKMPCSLIVEQRILW